MNKLLVTILLAILPLVSTSQILKLEGKVGDKYPIVLELEQRGEGLFQGRYAYLSTLRKNGDTACSWLTITPDPQSPYASWLVYDCNGEFVEGWHNVYFAQRQTLTANMTNIRGKSYTINAKVT